MGHESQVLLVFYILAGVWKLNWLCTEKHIASYIVTFIAENFEKVS